VVDNSYTSNGRRPLVVGGIVELPTEGQQLAQRYENICKGIQMDDFVVFCSVHRTKLNATILKLQHYISGHWQRKQHLSTTFSIAGKFKWGGLDSFRNEMQGIAAVIEEVIGTHLLVLYNEVGLTVSTLGSMILYL
jgi:hypothetical protein